MLLNSMKHFIICGLGIVGSIIAFIIFFLIYENCEVGFWSVLSGILTAVCFHLHWVKQKETLAGWHSYTSLKYLHFTGFISAVFSFAFMIWYLFLTLYYHIPLKPFAESTIIALIHAMNSGNWGIALAYYSYKYVLIIHLEQPITTE